MLTVISEPRLTVIPASKWSLEAYTNYILEQSDLTINFEQVLTNFMESLDQINQLFVVPLSVRSICQNYIDWLKTLTGRYVIEACRKFFDAKVLLKKKVDMKAVVEETINVTSHTEAFESYLQPSFLSNIESSLFESETPSPQSPFGSISVIRTPNKRPFENPEVKKYCQDSTVICAFGMKQKDLEAEIGKELTQEVLSTCKFNPLLWTSKLEEYIDSALKNTGLSTECGQLHLDAEIETPSFSKELFKEKITSFDEGGNGKSTLILLIIFATFTYQIQAVPQTQFKA
ncbi:11008_t:CDS:2 [Entrophospora sp. SA101]|nr:11008_t:CDS:2 [Entrophospora sp. SA101]CAJ0844000.1 3137_t:CDS:2 [Entrophospora sp. SA101]